MIPHIQMQIRDSKSSIAFTGAGISTSCGIPDFRGPRGVWTLQSSGQPLPRSPVCFALAQPSFTHQALVALLKAGYLKFISSQNVDGLHLRSGVPRESLAELHGSCFVERCSRCLKEYVRDFEIESVGFQSTGRKCYSCNGNLKDNVLDWDDALPAEDLEASERFAKEADLAICLGTSLQIAPAADIPLKTIRTYKDTPGDKKGKLVIINLQRTRHDNKAHTVVHAPCDEVMMHVMQALNITVPKYVRTDAVIVAHTQLAISGGGSERVYPFRVFLQSPHGSKCPISPMIEKVDFNYNGGDDADEGLIQTLGRASPFEAKLAATKPGQHRLHVVLHCNEAADEYKREIRIVYKFVINGIKPGCGQMLANFVSQETEYNNQRVELKGGGAPGKRKRMGKQDECI